MENQTREEIIKNWNKAIKKSSMSNSNNAGFIFIKIVILDYE